MEQVLRNMANYLLIEYCKEHNIDCSATYVTKDGRGFSYCLVVDNNVRPDFPPSCALARITFHKSQVPTYGW